MLEKLNGRYQVLIDGQHYEVHPADALPVARLLLLPEIVWAASAESKNRRSEVCIRIESLLEKHAGQTARFVLNDESGSEVLNVVAERVESNGRWRVLGG